MSYEFGSSLPEKYLLFKMQNGSVVSHSSQKNIKNAVDALIYNLNWLKSIKEHVNFERVLDPKDAMQTGDIDTWPKYEKIMQKYGWPVRQT
jgi:hypothetical protein